MEGAVRQPAVDLGDAGLHLAGDLAQVGADLPADEPADQADADQAADEGHRRRQRPGQAEALQAGDGGLEQGADQQRGDEGEGDNVQRLHHPEEHVDAGADDQQPPDRLGGDPQAPGHGLAGGGRQGREGGRAVRVPHRGCDRRHRWRVVAVLGLLDGPLDLVDLLLGGVALPFHPFPLAFQPLGDPFGDRGAPGHQSVSPLARHRRPAPSPRSGHFSALNGTRSGGGAGQGPPVTEGPHPIIRSLLAESVYPVEPLGTTLREAAPHTAAVPWER